MKMRKLIFNDQVKNENTLQIIKEVYLKKLKNRDHTDSDEIKLYSKILRSKGYTFIDVGKINDKESFMGLCWIFKRNDQYIAISDFGLEARMIDYKLIAKKLELDMLINDIKNMLKLISEFLNINIAVKNIEKRLGVSC